MSNSLEDAFKAILNNEIEKAISIYQNLLAENPHDPLIHHGLSIAFAKNENLSQALIHAKQAVQLENNNPIFYKALGNIYQKLKDDDNAIAAFESALKLDPNDAQTFANLALVYHKQKIFSKALHYYHQALLLDAENIATHYHLGLLFAEHEKLDEAILQLQNVLVLQPNHFLAAKLLADLYLTNNQYELALALYPDLINEQPHNADIYNNYGVALLKSGKPQEAIEQFSESLIYDPNHFDARNNLAACFIKHGRFDNAAQNYQILLTQKPTPEIKYNLAVALMALGEIQKAKKLFEEVLEQQANPIEALCNLAAIELKLNQKEIAKHYYQQILLLDPENQIANYMLSAINQDQRIQKAPQEYITNLFDNYASHYNYHMQTQLHYQVPEYFSEVLSTHGFKEFKSALDLGCGTGLTGVKLKENILQLTGVDLSETMLAMAEKTKAYQHLFQSDIQDFLTQDTYNYDLIFAADVFVYLGDLTNIFNSVKKHLANNGVFLFSVELLQDDQLDFSLQTTARYAHSKKYILDLLVQEKFSVIAKKEVVLREQDGKAIEGLVVLAK